MLKKVLFGLATLLVVLVALIIIQPSEYRVSRTLTMTAPAQDIFAQLNDFHRWEAWHHGPSSIQQQKCRLKALSPARAPSLHGPATAKSARDG